MSAVELLATRKAAAFDLDGTLVDTVGDLRMAAHLALLECGQPGLPPGYRMPNLHGVFPALIHAVIADRGVREEAWEPITQAYLHHYRELAHRHSELYPGVRELLDACRGMGVRLAVCTNKSRAPALQVLERCGILHYFDDVAGSDTVARPKPDPMPLLRAFSLLSVDPEDGCYVGDTHIDAISAAAAGTPFILHRSGYGEPAMLDGHPVAGAFGNYVELMASCAAKSS